MSVSSEETFDINKYFNDTLRDVIKKVPNFNGKDVMTAVGIGKQESVDIIKKYVVICKHYKALPFIGFFKKNVLKHLVCDDDDTVNIDKSVAELNKHYRYEFTLSNTNFLNTPDREANIPQSEKRSFKAVLKEKKPPISLKDDGTFPRLTQNMEKTSLIDETSDDSKSEYSNISSVQPISPQMPFMMPHPNFVNGYPMPQVQYVPVPQMLYPPNPHLKADNTWAIKRKMLRFGDLEESLKMFKEMARSDDFNDEEFEISYNCLRSAIEQKYAEVLSLRNN